MAAPRSGEALRLARCTVASVERLGEGNKDAESRNRRTGKDGIAMETTSRTRREFLKTSVLLGASLGAALAQRRGFCAEAAGRRRPNLLFICTDQQRIDDMSCAGNPYVKTPAIDSLAARGTRFTRSYCAFPLCSPSRASHVTSRMPYEVGVNTNSIRLPESVPSLGTLFKEAGYRTAWSGKWHLPETYPTKPGEIPGFEILFGVKDAGAQAPSKAGKARQPDAAPAESGEGGGRGTEMDPHMVKAAVRFLQEKRPEPFLLVVSLLNPHDVCGFSEQTPRKLNLPGDASRLPPPPANLNAPDLGPQSKNSGIQWPDLTWRQQWYYYYQLTERVDRLIGEVLGALRAAGLEQDTVVLFTSDHGEMAGAHRRIRKSSLYEEAMAVPFIIAGPGVPSGATDNAHLVSGLDVLPTLCDFAGIAPPPQARGLSVRKVLGEPGAPWRDVVFAAIGESQGRMARTARYKYNLYAEDKEELFDLQADSGEARNLAGDPAMAETLAAHRKMLRDWMEKTGDPFGKPATRAGPRGAAKGKNKK
jgi:arylsulfatase A-like enzyme